MVITCSLENVPNVQEKINQIEEFCLENELGSWVIVKESLESPFILTGYFDSETDASSQWQELRSKFIFLPAIPPISFIEHKDWQNAYKQYIKPWSHEDLHWIPLWEKDQYELPQGHIGIYLDAGMAFGTGAHETTRLCAKRLIEYRNTNRSKLSETHVIDAGCGSGILAISAKRLGFGHVKAFDIDPQAVDVAIENAKKNLESPSVDFFVANLEQGLWRQKADLLLANIQADILMANATALIDAIKTNGTLVLSGILDKEWELTKVTFEKIFAAQNLQFTVNSSLMGEWRDLSFSGIR